MLKINGIPGVFYHDKEYNPNNGEGAEIPIFIGRTGAPVEELKISKYENFKDAAKPVEEGGIGVGVEENPLLIFLKDFLARK